MIISLGAMGVGYAAWSDGLEMKHSISTADFKLAHKVNEGMHYLDNSKSLNLTVEGNTLEIKGEIYPSFDNEFPIVVENLGSIPAKLSGLNNEDNGDISKLLDKSTKRGKFSLTGNYNNFSSTKYSSTIIDPEEEVETFSLTIAPEDSKDDSSSYKLMSNSIRTESINSSSGDGEIDRLRSRIRELKDEISILEDEIREYEKEEDYEFNYELLFEQGV